MAKKTILSVEEQETIIRIGRDDKKARVYTSDSRWMKKLDKVTDRIRVHKSGRAIVATEYVVSEKYVKVAAPIKRKLTAEQRAKMSERMKILRKQKD